MASHDAIGESEQTPSLRAPSSEPSLTHRDVIGAQNRSPSRKRPRLDSGSGIARSMSADQAISSLDEAVGDTGDNTMDVDSRFATPEPQHSSPNKPAGTPSKVTINIRDPFQKNVGSVTNGHHDTTGDHSSDNKTSGTNGHIIKKDDASSSTSQRSASSPIIEVADTQSDGAEDVADVRLMGGQNISEQIEALYFDFPHSTDGGYIEAAEFIADLATKGLDFGVLQDIDKWMRRFQDCLGQDARVWSSALYEHEIFWEAISRIYKALFARSVLNENSRLQKDAVDGFSRTFLRTFTILFSRVLEVDATCFPEDAAYGDDRLLLSPDFVAAAKFLLRDDKGFIAKVLPTLDVDSNDIRAHVMNCFIDAGGPVFLTHIISANMNERLKDEQVLRKLLPFVEFCQILGGFASFYHGTDYCLQPSASTVLVGQLLEVFKAVHTQLLCSLDKQQDILNIEVRRLLLEYQVSLLRSALSVDPLQSKEAIREIVDHEIPGLEDSLTEIAIMVWKLKLALTYISKGRMDLRLQGIDMMAQQLVEFFNHHKDRAHDLRTSAPSPVLCFVADFLLKEKVTEFLFGVASHPQLIGRCSNVIGFLVVTNKFSRAQAQLIWRAIEDSPDPRIVVASFPIFSNLIRQLAQYPEHVEFADMILAETLPAMTPPALEFFHTLVSCLRDGATNYHFASTDKSEHHYRTPLDLAVELMRCLSATKEQPPNAQQVYERAAEMIASISSFAPDEVRNAFLDRCIESIRKHPQDGAAISQAIHATLKHSRLLTNDQLRQSQIVTILMQDFCGFVSRTQETNTRSTNQQLSREISWRLDLIWYLLNLEAEDVDEKLIRRFWSHLVGADALNTTARDIAWRKLTEIAFMVGTDTGFLERHAELLSPAELDRAFFTTEYFHFLQKRVGVQLRMQGSPQIDEDGSMIIPGVDLIWDAILQAPKNVEDEPTLTFLASRYLEASWLTPTSKVAFDKAHIALVKELVQRLKAAHRTIREGSSDAVNGIDSGTGQVLRADAVSEAETSFVRIVKVLRRILLHIRSMVEFRPQATVTIDMTDEEMPATSRGDALTIKCDVMRAKQPSVTRMLNMGTLDTCKQLYTRICMLLGEYNVSSFQVISGGKRLFLKEQGRMTLEDVGIARTPHIIVREPIGGDEARKEHIVPGKQWRTIFEQELVENLDVFYGFLDAADIASAHVRDLLKYLPRNENLVQAILDMRAKSCDLFPVSQPFKTGYTIDCLRELLETGVADEKVLEYGGQLLESILPTAEQLSQEPNTNPELIMETVSCLYDFYLFARDKHLKLFDDAVSVQQRLIILCDSANPHGRPGSLSWEVFEFCTDLASWSDEVWEEFASNPRTASMHEKMLLGQPDANVRRHAAQLIQRKLVRWESSGKASFTAYATFLWQCVADFIPRAVAHPNRAEETFNIAELTYKSLLRSGDIDEAQASRLASSWASLLAGYHHHEFVGREQPDAVLCGLSALLCSTVEVYPQIVTSTDKIRLMETLWWKFLFQKAPLVQAELDSLERELPALETTTRMALVRLISSIATEDDTIDIMAALLNDVRMQQFDRQFDRTGTLRSPAGYIGLKNLGQTCYMNSLVTQLFMNPVFRAFMLSCAPITIPKASPLLHETQRLFAIMQNSFHNPASALDFTKNIVTLTEENIDVREQMDVDEFMNTLFHRWEEQMPSNELKERLRSVYTGKTVQQIKSKECEHVSEREDTCLAIPCDVQGNMNLGESLKAYIQGDVMEGDNKYKCERCNRLVNAVKRTCLKDIPDHLMLQLKRFAFDLETYSRNKINEFFAFPMSIDMAPYTFEHLANPDQPLEADMFDLVGVIVHKGQAEHGHYVSYIRARPTGEGEAPTWLLFDDSDVTVFDPKEFQDACFGGPTNKDSTMGFGSSMKTYNAYMLFYQRRSSLQQHPWVARGSKDLRKVPLAPDMASEIIQENRALLETYSMFDESTREYVRLLVSKLEKLDHGEPTHAQHSRLLKIIWKYLTTIWARTREIPGIEDVLNALRDIGAKCERCCFTTIRWFVQSRIDDGYRVIDPLRDMLLKIGQPKIRTFFRSFILETLRQIRGSDALYGADITETKPALTGTGAITLLTRLASFIPEDLAHNFRAWEDYFGLLADIASLGPQESFALISDGVLTACFEAILCGSGISQIADSPSYKDVAQALKRKAAPSYNQLIRLASILYRYVDMDREAMPEADAGIRLDYWDEGGVPWTEHEEYLLLEYNKKEGGLVWLCEVLQKWTSEGTGFVPGDIVKTLLQAKSAVVHALVETFITIIKDFEPRYAEPFLRSAKFLPMYLPSQSLLDDFCRTMRTCSREANGTNIRSEDGYNGALCHRFWSTIHQLAAGNLESSLDDQTYFDKQFLSTCQEWGPVLLTYQRDWDVGRLTERLLNEALFRSSEYLMNDGVRELNDMDAAATLMFWGCERQVRFYSSMREPAWQQFMSPTYNIMSACVKYLEDNTDVEGDQTEDAVLENDKIFGRFDEVKVWFDNLPVRSEDDFELAQSSELTWNGLDIADDALADATSDLTEMTDDEVGSLLTTGLDG